MNPRTLCDLCRHRHKAHSVRGFLSTVAKKERLNFESTKNKGGERCYKLAK